MQYIRVPELTIKEAHMADAFANSTGHYTPNESKPDGNKAKKAGSAGGGAAAGNKAADVSKKSGGFNDGVSTNEQKPAQVIRDGNVVQDETASGVDHPQQTPSRTDAR